MKLKKVNPPPRLANPGDNPFKFFWGSKDLVKHRCKKNCVPGNSAFLRDLLWDGEKVIDSSPNSKVGMVTNPMIRDKQGHELNHLESLLSGFLYIWLSFMVNVGYIDPSWYTLIHDLMRLPCPMVGTSLMTSWLTAWGPELNQHRALT